MSLPRWFRKNKTKVLAVVVIVIMVGFIGGTYIQQLGQRRKAELNKAVAYFADNKKMTNKDLLTAQQELRILQALNVNRLLMGSSDFKSILLGELLFTERRTSPISINRMKQIIRENEYRIGSKQINAIYNRSVPSNVYWLLLKNEAEQAGIRVPDEQAGKVLASIVPMLFANTTYGQLMKALMNNQGITEEEAFRAFGKMMAVLDYGKIVSSSEDVTNLQIMQAVSLEEEKIDVEFIKFDSAVFAEGRDVSKEQELLEHFSKYKSFFPHQVSEENAYGFGYKLTDSVVLEYIAVKYDDISEIVTPPRQEEAEEYYQKNIQQFTESVPIDPNDPSSPSLERTKGYAEVASLISRGLLQKKMDSKAEAILQELKAQTEAGLPASETELANLSVEQLKELAGNYDTAAEQLSQKYNIKVYSGRTGLLSASDIQQDKYLGTTYIRKPGYIPLGLARFIFAIDELGGSELGPFDVPKPRMYENIGPVRDVFGKTMMLVRVIEAKKASEPVDINYTHNKAGLDIDEQEVLSDDVYSVKDSVANDLKKLAAMSTTKSKTEEFVKLVAKDGWDDAIEKFNKLYGETDSQDETQPNTFELQSFSGLQRISREALDTWAVQRDGNPSAQVLLNDSEIERLFLDMLYQLVPADRDSLETTPLIIEFQPHMSYYCIKSLSITRLNQEQYEQLKAIRAYRENILQSQNISAVHYSPENILKRMNFRAAAQQTPDVNAPEKSEGSL